MLTSDNVKMILRRLSGMLRVSSGSNTLGTVSFVGGAALNDLVIDSDGFTGNFPLQYRVKVSSEGTPDGFRYSDDGGVTWVAQANMSTAKVALSNGIGVKWGATTGHTLGTEWVFTVDPGFAAERLRDFVESHGDIEVLYDMINAVYSLGKSPSSAYAKVKSEAKAVVTALVSALDANSLDEYLTSQSAMVNADLVDMSVATVGAARVIPKSTILGEYNFTDVDTGSWTAGNTIDVSKYGGGLIELFALSAVTDAATDGVVGIDGVAFDGTVLTETAAVAFGGSLAQYDVVDLSVAYPQRWKSISNVTVTGGAAGQAFQIRTKEDFAPIL